MARPVKEGIDHFPHSVFASENDKVSELIERHGAIGYAWYFIHLEYLYRDNEYCLDISSEETITAICQKLKISLEEYHSVLTLAIDNGLFDKERYVTDKCLTSDGVNKRAAKMTKDRERMRKAYKRKKR